MFVIRESNAVYTKYMHNIFTGQIWSTHLKIVLLSWNLAPKLIQVCRIKWGINFFCFRVEIPFLGKFGPKTGIVILCWNLPSRLIQICRIQLWCSLFSVFDWKTPFFKGNLVQKVKTVILGWYLVPRLIHIFGILFLTGNTF